MCREASSSGVDDGGGGDRDDDGGERKQEDDLDPAAVSLAALRGDGRVRIAARRGLEQRCVSYHHPGADVAVDAVVAEFDRPLDEIDDECAEHVEQAREELTFFHRSIPPWLFDNVHDALDDR